MYADLSMVDGATKHDAYAAMRQEVMAFGDHMAFAPAERTHFARVVQNDIR